MRHLRASAPALALCALLTGCGEREANVTGTVTFDGTPVPSGSIVFASADGKPVREGGVITDGNFQLKLPPGKYKVEVTAQKVVGKRRQKGFDGKEEEIELHDEMIPDRYNTQTVLTEEIKPGSNTIKLPLTSKP